MYMREDARHSTWNRKHLERSFSDDEAWKDLFGPDSHLATTAIARSDHAEKAQMMSFNVKTRAADFCLMGSSDIAQFSIRGLRQELDKGRFHIRPFHMLKIS